MRPGGWYRHRYGNHGERLFSGGRPANLVRGQGSGSDGDPLPDWRWWTVCLPGLLALAVSGVFVLYAGLASSLGCLDGCGPVTEGMPVGTAGTVAVAIAAVALLVAGLITPGWRRATAAGLWVAFALACGSAALIATARPVLPVAPAGQPAVPAVAVPSFGVAACSAIGGRVLSDYALCFGVPYVDVAGQLDHGAVSYAVGGQLVGPADTTGRGATRAECQSGRYPDGPAGPVARRPGRWDAQLSLCLP